MRKEILVALFLLSPLGAVAQTGDRNVLSIRQTYELTNRQIAEAEKDFSGSEIFVTELLVNRGGTSYPAVGIFRKTVTFYYTYGNRETSAYPNRILKISVSIERAAMKSTEEYYFDRSGQMIFVFENDSGTEGRYYFATGRLVRFHKGQQIIDARSRDAQAKAKSLTDESVRLIKLFLMAQE